MWLALPWSERDVQRVGKVPRGTHCAMVDSGWFKYWTFGQHSVLKSPAALVQFPDVYILQRRGDDTQWYSFTYPDMFETSWCHQIQNDQKSHFKQYILLV